MSKIVVVGSINTDMVICTRRLPGPGETVLGGTFLMNPGGKGANQAVAAAKLDGDVVFIGKVGDDSLGRDAVANMRRCGVDTRFIGVDPDSASGVATITVDESGENCIAVASGANACLSGAEVQSAWRQIDDVSIVLMQLETPLQTVQDTAALAKQSGATTILNPAPAQDLPDSLLALIDIITPNEHEAHQLTGVTIECDDSAKAAAQRLQQRGVPTVIITMGDRGAWIQTADFVGCVSAIPAKVVDTTAAGDTFNGALAVELALGTTLVDAVRVANHAASIAVTRPGAQGSCPTRKDLTDSLT
ncbi:ribokinase [Crateriforma conspicua]|uniref:ribokinase n=1 Tax=Crateriforma conspicua TaxID=2527996 RepID=UPI00118B3E62|nr:ribokinase [Crateriforma conspicua]QDV63528.1 Ribokinase [Crateriforma conspicua]